MPNYIAYLDSMDICKIIQILSTLNLFLLNLTC